MFILYLKGIFVKQMAKIHLFSSFQFPSEWSSRNGNHIRLSDDDFHMHPPSLNNSSGWTSGHFKNSKLCFCSTQNENETRRVNCFYHGWPRSRFTTLWERGKKKWGEWVAYVRKSWCESVTLCERKRVQEVLIQKASVRPLAVHHTGLSGPIQISSEPRLLFRLTGWKPGTSPPLSSILCAPPALRTAWPQ